MDNHKPALVWFVTICTMQGSIYLMWALGHSLTETSVVTLFATGLAIRWAVDWAYPNGT